MDILKLLLPLFGVFVGWVLTQLTNYFNIYRTDKKVYKETLFYLLELYHQLSTVKSIETASEAYVRSLSERIEGFSNNTEDSQNMIIIMNSLFKKFHYPRIENELKELNEKYEYSIEKLSSIDPITAFRLKGKNRILEYLNNWNEFANNTIIENSELMFDQNSMDFVSKLKPQIEKEFLNETMGYIKEIIISTSGKINRKTKGKIDTMTFLSEQESSIEINDRMNKYVDEQILPILKKQTATNKV